MRLLFAVSAFVVLFSATPSRAQYPNREPIPPSHKGDRTFGNWQRLAEVGPGHGAVVTMRDGTLRGGWIAGVDGGTINLQAAGETLPLAASDIAVVRVQRSNRTLLYGVIGYFVTATAAILVVNHKDNESADPTDDDHKSRDLVVAGSLGGIPGALLGALIGQWTSGDVEFVP
ncbi:MAG TPA: hypothetical protein VF128_01320 [Gemmatimonadaceae bacterium]